MERHRHWTVFQKDEEGTFASPGGATGRMTARALAPPASRTMQA